MWWFQRSNPQPFRKELVDSNEQALICLADFMLFNG